MCERCHGVAQLDDKDNKLPQVSDHFGDPLQSLTPYHAAQKTWLLVVCQDLAE